MQSLGQINNVEAKRRLALIENLERQVGSGYTSQADTDLLGLHPTSTNNTTTTTTASSPYTTNTTFKTTGSITQQALRHQDEMIDELANGVARLKHQTMQVNDEAMMQNRMLDDMDGDVENARIGLETETARALKLKEDQSVWRLYLIIAGLSVLLFLLITTGLG
jgi:DNA-binding transcriptional regulator YdaS (Cro superfamily)